MTEYTIEKNIPRVPNPGGMPRRYPFADMEVGDSFLMDCRVNIAGARANYWHRKLGFKFECRTVDGGTRVWRIE